MDVNKVSIALQLPSPSPSPRVCMGKCSRDTTKCFSLMGLPKFLTHGASLTHFTCWCSTIKGYMVAFLLLCTKSVFGRFECLIMLSQYFTLLKKINVTAFSLDCKTSRSQVLGITHRTQSCFSSQQQHF